MSKYIFCFLFILSPWGIKLTLAQGDPGQKAGSSDADSLKNTKPSIYDQDEYFLALEKPGKEKRLRYYRGDKLRFKLKGDDFKYTRIIGQILDSTLVIEETPIPISKIEWVYYKPNRPFLNTLKNFFFIGGIGYFLIDTVNNSFSPNENTLFVSGAFLLPATILVFPTKRRKLRLGGARYLKTIKTF